MPSFRAVYRVAGSWLLPTLWLLPIISGLPLWVRASEDSGLLRVTNATAPILLLLFTGVAAAQTVRRYPIALWTPYIAFLADSALFFGVGPLVYVFGNAATLAQLSTGNLAINHTELAWTNVLTEVGIASAMPGLWAYSRVSRRRDRAVATRFVSRNRNLPIQQIAVLFLIAGGLLRYGLLLPSRFGVIDVTVPGTISNLSNLFELGLAVAGYLAVRRGGSWRWVFWCLLLPNLAVAILTFSKTEAMLALLIPAFGCFLAHRRLLRLAPWVVTAVLLFVVLQPLVHHGRHSILAATGNIDTATLGQRLAITENYGRAQADGGGRQARSQSAWTRLAYAGPQAFAMSLHDEGVSNHSMQNAWMYFIPRFIWRDKPIMVGPADDFYYRVTGNHGSFLGLSVYGDAYWEAGWPGVVGFMLAMGLLFGWLSSNTLTWLGADAMLYLPLVLMGLTMGLLGPTNFMANGIVGGMPIYLGYMLVLAVFMHLSRRTQASHRTARPATSEGTAS